MKKKNFISMLLSLTLVTAPVANFVHNNTLFAEEEYVNVPDYNMKRGLLMALASVNGTGKYDFSETEIRNAKFKKSELEKIKKINPELCVAHTCTEEGVKIIDLTGIEHCINLEDLSLVNQRVTNLSPIKNLTKLKKLELRNNSNNGKNIEDISAISNMKNLEYLNLSQSKIKDTAPLSNLTKLKHLDLMGSKISTLEFVKNLTNLTYLDVSLSYIDDITPLENCINLEVLNLSQNPKQPNEESKSKIKDISALKNLTQLRELNLDNHNLTDVTSLQYLKNLNKITLLNNKIENFEPTFVIPNLIELWTLGNKTGLENKIENYKKAKEFFNLLNKQTLTKEDVKTIEDLENSNDAIKNYFSDETLKKLSSVKEELKTKDLNLDLFGHLNLNGEIVSVSKLKGYKGSMGLDFLSRLPKNVEVTIKKSNSNENSNGEITSGIVQLDEKENYILKVAIVDKNNKLIKEKVNFVSSKDNKVYCSENGYLTIDQNMAQVVQWLETVFSLQSEKYTANKSIKFTKTTPTKLGVYDGNTYVDQKSELEKLLVIKLSEKNSSIEPEEPTPGITPTPSEIPDISNPKPDNHSTTENPLTTENIGIKGNKIYYKFVDENGTTVTDDINVKAYSDEIALALNSTTEGNTFVFDHKSNATEFVLQFTSEKYIINDSVKFEVGSKYENGTSNYFFKKLILNDNVLIINDTTDLSKIDSKYFTINVKTKSAKSRNTNYVTTNINTYSNIFNNTILTSTTNKNEIPQIKNDTTINNQNTENLIKTVVGIKWNTENFKNEVGTYDLTGDLILPDGVSNPKNLKAKIRIIVKEKKSIVPSTEALGELLTNGNKQILKVVIANEKKNIITEPIVVTDGIYSYISKDGYVEIPVLNGNHEIKLADDKYIEVEDRYKESKIITYSGYFNRLININNNLLNEISSLGLKRQLRLIVKENKVDPEKPVDSDKTEIIFSEDKSSKIEGTELKNIDGKDLKLIVEKNSNILKDLKLFEGKDVNIFDIYLQNKKTKEKFELPKGDYKVTLPKTKNNDVISVNYVDKNGNLEKHNFTQTENTITFETTHLSLYAIEYKVVNENNSNSNSNNAENNTTTENDEKNNTNSSSNTNLSSKQKLVKTNISSTSQLVTVLLGLGAVVISKKKKFK